MTRCGAGSTGSMYTSSAPSLWQEIGTTITPSRTVPPASGAPPSCGVRAICSGVPSSSSRGVPSLIACLAWRITDGSAQAPPIQPRSSPDAVMIAREPS